jgi:hypothetical protein
VVPDCPPRPSAPSRRKRARGRPASQWGLTPGHQRPGCVSGIASTYDLCRASSQVRSSSYPESVSPTTHSAGTPASNARASLRLASSPGASQLEVLGHSRFLTAHGVEEPLLWHVQRSIKKGRSVSAGLEQKDADLAIRLPVGRSTVLIGYPC